jgi:hypothetical protein
MAKKLEIVKSGRPLVKKGNRWVFADEEKSGKKHKKAGRPRLYDEPKKYNKTIRVSESQNKVIQKHFPTLQSFFEHVYASFLKELKSKKSA